MKTYKLHTVPGGSHVEYFYDSNPTVRSWTVLKMDAQGNQIGDAIYVYSRREAELAALHAELELNIQ